MSRYILTLLMFLSLVQVSWSNIYNIEDYGALGDGSTNNAKAIQSAINDAIKNGGGQVVVPPGRFVSGTIHMKSNVELVLKKGGVLLGSLNHLDYESRRWTGFIMAYQANNISISGEGTIDGRGDILGCIMDSLFYAGELDSADYNFKEKRPLAYKRPMIVLFTECTDIHVSGVILKNSASWVQNYVLCKRLIVDGITVESDSYWNNDGIDITDCQNVVIKNCAINSSDDGICLKSFWYTQGYSLCDSIYIRNCRVRSSASALKLGTSSKGGFKNVVMEDIFVYDTYRSAIAIENYQNGIMENILFQNITARNTGNAIFIRRGDRESDDSLKRSRTTFKNITIRNVKVEVPFGPPDSDYKIRGPMLSYFHNTFPSSITGLPGRLVENVVIENVEIIYPGRGLKAYANMPVSDLRRVPEQVGVYPEFSMFGELPAWGFYIRHVDGLVMKNVKLKIKDSDYRPAIVCDDVKNLTVEKLKVCGDEKELKIFQKDTQNVKIKE